MRIAWNVLKSARKYIWQYSFGFIGLVVATIASFYLPWALRSLTQLATEGSTHFASEALVIGLLLLATTTIQSVGTSLSGYMNHYTALHVVADLRTRLYQKYQQMSLRYFNKNRTGDLTGRVVNDAMEAEILIAHVIPEFIVNLLTFVGVGVLLLTINVKLALISLITIPFLLLITIWQNKYLAPLWGKESKTRGDISGKIQENLSGMKEIQIFNRQQEEQRHVAQLALKHTKTYLRASKFYETSVPLLAFVTALGTVFVVIVGGRLIDSGEATIADIVGFIAYLGMFYSPVNSFSGLVEMAGRAEAGLKRVYEVLGEGEEVQEKRQPNILSKVNGEIIFQGISFSYQDNIPILKDFDLTIKAGKTIAIVGTTGVGKTTLASLINRFYDPQEGAIYMDGTDIRDVSLSSLRDNISMVLQDTFLFDGTVYDNISYGWKNATYEEIIAASKAAKAHDFIMQMEQGYDTVIGERGVRLSGGQKQRLSIARAILRNAPILILDEATSALDAKTEQDIQQALIEISRDRTTIVIAHRLSTIRHADQIVVLEGRGVAEMGTHEELLQRDGLYAKLYAVQAS